jgi:hypothetical protein
MAVLDVVQDKVRRLHVSARTTDYLSYFSHFRALYPIRMLLLLGCRFQTSFIFVCLGVISCMDLYFVWWLLLYL